MLHDRQVVAYGATGRCAEDRVVTGIVASDAADDGAPETPSLSAT